MDREHYRPQPDAQNTREQRRFEILERLKHNVDVMVSLKKNIDQLPKGLSDEDLEAFLETMKTQVVSSWPELVGQKAERIIEIEHESEKIKLELISLADDDKHSEESEHCSRSTFPVSQKILHFDPS